MSEEYNEEDFIDEEAYIEEEDQEVTAAPAWIMSLAVHSLLLFIMGVIYFGANLDDNDEPPIRIPFMEQPPEIIKKEELPRDIEEKPITIDEPEVESPQITTLDVEIEPVETEDPIEEEPTEPRGQEEANADVATGGTAAFMAIGANANAAGLKGSRTGHGKKKALGENGGTPGSENAVRAALMWFKRHQSENGQWDVDGYMDNCQEGPRCEPGTAHTIENGDGDCATTAYALLCFLGAGHDHRAPGTFRGTVASGLEWLKSVQNPDGSFGVKKRNYENGVCTMALCEALAMTGDPSLKEPAQRAVNHLLREQAKSDGFEYGGGWYYKGANPKENDSSVTGWCVMALKAAKSADLDVGDGWEGSKQWLNAAWRASNEGKDPESMGSDSQSTFCYRYNQIDNTVRSKKLECVGALCAVFLGKTPGDGILDSLVNTVASKQIPTAYPCNTYYLYYNTLAVFQYGGKHWKDWNMQVRDMLVDAQHGAGSGCYNGSWDYEGTKFHGHDTGRLLSTAYCCLSLEVYYRHERINKRRQKAAR